MREQQRAHLPITDQTDVEQRAGSDTREVAQNHRRVGTRVELHIGNGDGLPGLDVADEVRPKVIDMPAADDRRDASVVPVAMHLDMCLVVVDLGESDLRDTEVTAQGFGCGFHHRCGIACVAQALGQREPVPVAP